MAGYLYRNPVDGTVEFSIFPDSAVVAAKPRPFDIVGIDEGIITLTRCYFIAGSVLNMAQTADLSFAMTASDGERIVLCAKINTDGWTVELDQSPDYEPSLTQYVHMPLYELQKTVKSSGDVWTVTCDLRPGVLSVYV